MFGRQSNKETELLKKWFIAGLIVVAPIAVTAWLIWSLVSWLDHLVAAVLPISWNPSTYLPFNIPGSGLAITAGTILLVGCIAAGWVGKNLDRWWQAVISHVPIVRSIYRAVRQIMETAFGSSAGGLKSPVLVEFPVGNAWSIGFITGTSSEAISGIIGSKTISVFVPTAPNPTSGFLLNIPEDSVRRLDMDPETALRTIVSAGLVQSSGIDGTKIDRRAQ